MWRVSARRAASSWRAVIRSGSVDLSRYWPKASVAPEVARPWIRPLCALRNLRRVRRRMAIRLSQSQSAEASGRIAPRPPDIALSHLLVLRHRIVLQNLALEDPHLDAAGAVGGEGGGNSVIDVRPQRMQRHATFAVPLHAGDLGAAQAARTVDADGAGAQPHGRLHRTLHGTAKGDAALELLRDRFGHQLRVELRLPDLDDVDDHVGIGELGNLLAQLLDVGALLADHHARPRRLNGYPAFLVRPLDDDLGDRRLLELLHQLLANLDVFEQQPPILVLAGVPA